MNSKQIFNPRDYLNGKIHQDCCCHELLSTSGLDDGIYGTTFDCLICGKNFHYSHNDYPNLDNKFIFYSYGCLNNQEYSLIMEMLQYISKKYVDEDNIDIAKIFNTIYPNIKGIANLLQTPTTKDRNKVLIKYDKLIYDEEKLKKK